MREDAPCWVAFTVAFLLLSVLLLVHNAIMCPRFVGAAPVSSETLAAIDDGLSASDAAYTKALWQANSALSVGAYKEATERAKRAELSLYAYQTVNSNMRSLMLCRHTWWL